MAVKIIDPHVHLFDLNIGDYHWLKKENPPFWPDKPLICKSFDEHNIALSKPLSLSGFVHIEAGFDNEQPEREIDWLESTVKTDFKSVASVDLTQSPAIFSRNLKLLKMRRSVVGVRHILDDKACDILNNVNAIQNLGALAAHQLLFECQLSFYDTQAINLIAQQLSTIPTLAVIINHAGFIDDSTTHSRQAWRCALEQLSSLPRLAIKCSGWEMSNRDYTAEVIFSTTQECIEVLGVDRVMMASNFPLCLFSISYQGYWQRVIEILPKRLTNQLCYENAKNWYNLV